MDLVLKSHQSVHFFSLTDESQTFKKKVNAAKILAKFSPHCGIQLESLLDV